MLTIVLLILFILNVLSVFGFSNWLSAEASGKWIVINCETDNFYYDPIKITEAYYGWNCVGAKGVVTDKLAAACNGKKECVYQIDHHSSKLGDPAPGCHKDFTYYWICDPGQPEVFEIRTKINGLEYCLAQGEKTGTQNDLKHDVGDIFDLIPGRDYWDKIVLGNTVQEDLYANFGHCVFDPKWQANLIWAPTNVRDPALPTSQINACFKWVWKPHTNSPPIKAICTTRMGSTYKMSGGTPDMSVYRYCISQCSKFGGVTSNSGAIDANGNFFQPKPDCDEGSTQINILAAIGNGGSHVYPASNPYTTAIKDNEFTLTMDNGNCKLSHYPTIAPYDTIIWRSVVSTKAYNAICTRDAGAKLYWVNPYYYEIDGYFLVENDQNGCCRGTGSGNHYYHGHVDLYQCKTACNNDAACTSFQVSRISAGDKYHCFLFRYPLSSNIAVDNTCVYGNHRGCWQKIIKQDGYSLVGNNHNGICRDSDGKVELVTRTSPKHIGVVTAKQCKTKCDEDAKCSCFELSLQIENYFTCYLFYYDNRDQHDITAPSGGNANGCYRKPFTGWTGKLLFTDNIFTVNVSVLIILVILCSIIAIYQFNKVLFIKKEES